MPIDINNMYSKVKEYYQAKIKINSVSSLWASKLGHPCISHLVHCQLNWRKANPYTVASQRNFDEGKTHEHNVIRLLEDCGYIITQRETPVIDDNRNIHGKIDGIIEIDGEKAILEVKSSNCFQYKKTRNLNDFDDWKSVYIDQCQFYMHVLDIGQTIIAFKNKNDGEIKFFSLSYDVDRVLYLLERADLINDYIRKNKIPAPETGNHCEFCPFSHLCKRTEITTETKVKLDEQLAIALGEWHSKKQTVKEFKQLEAFIKEHFPEPGTWVCGDFVIHKKEYSTTKYVYPENIKEYLQRKYGTKVPATRFKVEEL